MFCTASSSKPVRRPKSRFDRYFRSGLRFKRRRFSRKARLAAKPVITAKPDITEMPVQAAIAEPPVASCLAGATRLQAGTAGVAAELDQAGSQSAGAEIAAMHRRALSIVRALIPAARGLACATTCGSEALRNRWGILAVLFVVRLTMAFQFQSVAAVAPLLGTKFGVSLADIGLLIGLYFTPGIVLCVAGRRDRAKVRRQDHRACRARADADRRTSRWRCRIPGAADGGTADRRRRRRAAQRPDDEDGRRLVRRPRDRNRDGDLRQFMAGRHCDLPC